MSKDSVQNDGTGTVEEQVGRLSQLSSRTNLMAIDAVLRLLPHRGRGLADAAMETGIVARRVMRATRDLKATISALG